MSEATTQNQSTTEERIGSETLSASQSHHEGAGEGAEAESSQETGTTALPLEPPAPSIPPEPSTLERLKLQLEKAHEARLKLDLAKSEGRKVRLSVEGVEVEMDSPFAMDYLNSTIKTLYKEALEGLSRLRFLEKEDGSGR